MVDSDHGMRCACVTRRSALGGSAAVTGATLKNVGSAYVHWQTGKGQLLMGRWMRIKSKRDRWRRQSTTWAFSDNYRKRGCLKQPQIAFFFQFHEVLPMPADVGHVWHIGRSTKKEGSFSDLQAVGENIRNCIACPDNFEVVGERESKTVVKLMKSNMHDGRVDDDILASKCKRPKVDNVNRNRRPRKVT